MFNIQRFNPFRNPLNLRSLSHPRAWNWKKIKIWSIRIGIGLMLFILLLFAWYAKDLPTPGKIKRRQASAATQILDRNGNELYAVHGDIKRILISNNDMPKSIKEATITAEDRSFYKHHGINVKGILRALYNNITNKYSYLSGGSTITQQFVKNALLDPKKTFTRKIKELILTIEIEVMYSKDDILAMYLNEIPYGSNAYGIEAASQTFYGKKAKDLTLAESATLAALPKAPTYYSPYGIHPDKRQIRVEYILDSMADLGYISRDEANVAKKEAKEIKFTPRRENISAPHFVMYVKELLVDKYGEQMVEEGGLKVTTTLDPDKQKVAEEAINSAAARRFDSINASNASLVSIDPKNGQVLAMVGSRDFFDESIDGQVNVAIAERQPGSAFKPVVYATAFKDKYNPAFNLWDVTTDFGNYTPQNYDGATRGPVTARKALAGSLNIPAVKMLYLAGMDNVLDQAHKMGITTLNDRDRYGLSLVLGGGEIKLIDLATAYGVFANKGSLAPTNLILKVVDSNNKVLEEFKEDKKDVLDPQIAYEISSILSDNQARSYVFGSRSALYFDDRPVAAKTGTTSEYRDAWTFGYTPSLVTGVWVGNNDNSPMTAGAAGAMAAAPIWRDYMAKALANSPVEDFEVPNGIEEITVDKYTNKLPSGGETITDIFASWQIPKDRSKDVGKIRIDKYTGNLATDDCPDQFVEEKIVANIHSELPDNPAWERPVRAYAASMGLFSSNGVPEGEPTCAGLTNKTTITIKSPADNSTVSGNFTISVSVDSSVQIKSVEFLIDENSIGVDKTKPYSISYNADNLSGGKHRISVIATDVSGLSSSGSVVVSKGANDKTPPGPVSLKSISPGANYIDIIWLNPSDIDVVTAKIYISRNKNSVGSLNNEVNVSPDSESSIKISNLDNGKTYYITIKAIDSSGLESTNNTPYEATTL
ncbi:MAG: Penicillin-binding protein, 1A family [Berkelbacteria bacterium GW2011_GWB1_38_5]|uniref:Penicillin-binding protein, 1A family n=2 Tax=Candidatus Berkelbacteria TaxID=1618330 RepID=A0A0G0LGN4_9BACT|nr:MAG: Penicillin-binding protein, 1A family [Berkelbacteria bacterium GW2011_GWB1_38_5]KKQ91058.1 MAG: Penicillin-binding protein, 1A family [Berkelbacteria bacterium GW2011_GWA1_39_10]